MAIDGRGSEEIGGGDAGFRSHLVKISLAGCELSYVVQVW